MTLTFLLKVQIYRVKPQTQVHFLEKNVAFNFPIGKENVECPLHPLTPPPLQKKADSLVNTL